MSEMLKLSSIRIDGDTQLRAETDQETIDRYAQDMRDGDVFPAVIVYHDGAHTWLSDGFHRYFAVELTGNDEIEAEVRQGTQRDAILHAAEANRKHGLQLTNKDKRRVVTLFLNDAEWSQWSDREIARRCGVTHPFVSQMRKELSGNCYQIERKVERNGTTYTMNAANIGTPGKEEREQLLRDVYEGMSPETVAFLEEKAENLRRLLREQTSITLRLGTLFRDLREKLPDEQVQAFAWEHYCYTPADVIATIGFTHMYGEIPLKDVPPYAVDAMLNIMLDALDRIAKRKQEASV